MLPSALLRLRSLGQGAYFALYYAFLFTQSYVNVWRVNHARTGVGSIQYSAIHYCAPEVAAVKYGRAYTGPGGKAALIMERTVGNFLEQQAPFLAATWLHAVLVPGGAQRAAACGVVYVASRALYPALFYVGHPWLQLATVPGYVVIWGQLALVVAATAPRLPWHV
jgi:uncharacterized MAPEG superfamily protein